MVSLVAYKYDIILVDVILFISANPSIFIIIFNTMSAYILVVVG